MKIFTNFDQFYEMIKDWDLDFKQISYGQLKIKLDLHQINGGTIERSNFNNRLDMSGASPKNKASFTLTTPISSNAKLCGIDINSSHLTELSPGKEWTAITQPGFDVIVLNITHERIQQVALNAGYEYTPLLFGLKVHKLLSGESQYLTKLASFILSSSFEWQRSALEESFILRIVQICSRSNTQRPVKISHANRGFDKAVGFIKANLHKKISKSELLDISHLASRTLEYSFKDHFNLPPQTYIKYLKLNMVHNDLIYRAKGERISDIARAHGFEHMNHFASDYKSLFGCLPSEL